ncbi:hypothetical protein HAV15_000520 [Penicillium sp. str. |nr:hypothetical protein HAV15_000520 [Penicillium sp. str. \
MTIGEGTAARYRKVYGNVPSVLRLEDWTALEAINDPDRYLGGPLSNILTTSHNHGILFGKCQEGLDCIKNIHYEPELLRAVSENIWSLVRDFVTAVSAHRRAWHITASGLTNVSIVDPPGQTDNPLTLPH